MKSFGRLLAVSCVAGAVAVGCITGAWASGAADTPADVPTSTVEDYSYPGADKIYAEQGIRLKRGDGNIMLAKCGSEPNLIEVSAREMNNQSVCFRVQGKSGYLSLEMPMVGGIRGNNYSNIQVDMTVDGKQVTFPVKQNSWTAVGENADPQRRDHTLIEIRAAK
ncbi:hypothetical protein [Streptoalloteichus hindustanus]|uniref:Secreted protein n=1 Tax=Streptoalloteichus hindustanus TaxID=2017 RepID=A0A1M4YYB5_STRHI|nr:hypothetical protein [Streptoalloteichus hindustanus]SHF10688.1 hypothetical protein SAMN05444320_102531 [Streptoalloteichus hindustanus]